MTVYCFKSSNIKTLMIFNHLKIAYVNWLSFPRLNSCGLIDRLYGV